MAIRFYIKKNFRSSLRRKKLVLSFIPYEKSELTFYYIAFFKTSRNCSNETKLIVSVPYGK